MDKGMDFLKSQINNAVAQHRAFTDSLRSHADSADDPRFRALCEKFLPRMTQHQGMLEQYQRSIGAGEGGVKKAISGVLETGKEWLTASRGDDYLGLVGDIVMARQAEDTFKTFREGGRILGEESLRKLGELGEREHDEYVAEANRLIQQLFVEHVQVAAPVSR
jgi:hypothetical protein